MFVGIVRDRDRCRGVVVAEACLFVMTARVELPQMIGFIVVVLVEVAPNASVKIATRREALT